MKQVDNANAIHVPERIRAGRVPQPGAVARRQWATAAAGIRPVMMLVGAVLLHTVGRTQPVVSSVSPLLANPGASVSISGSGFNTTALNNIVFFGATKGAVTTASATSLTVTVPSGAKYGPIRVTNTGTSLTGAAGLPFLPSFDNSLYVADTINLATAVNFTAASPFGVVIADFDGDGKPDVATANGSTANSVSVFRNTATSGAINSSSLSAKVDFAVGASALAIDAGDLDGDGKQDIVVISESGTKISIFRNTATSGTIATSSFAAKVDIATTGGGEAVTIADVDGNGKPEIIVTNYGGSNVSVYKNVATAGSITTASFTKVDIAAASNTLGVRLADLNGDNKPDMLVTNFTSSTVSVFQNTSTSGTIATSSFAPRVDFAAGLNPYDVAVADFDGDGKQDLIVSNSGTNTISVLRGASGTGTINSSFFASKVDVTTQYCPRELKVADMNGDGKPDLVSANTCPSVSTLFRNKSTSGSISFAQSTLPLGGTERLDVGDIDGDKLPDVVTFQVPSTSLAIFRNIGVSVPPVPVTIGAFTPTTATAGTTITITGTGFSNTATNNVVYFGVVKGTVLSATTTSISVSVPIGAAFMPITVTNVVSGLTAYSSMPFSPDYDNSVYAAGVIALEPLTNFYTGSLGFQEVAAADIDGDGMIDVALSKGDDNKIRLQRNTAVAGSFSASSFGTATNITTSAATYRVKLADLNGDGKPELITSGGSGAVSVYRNTATSGVINSSTFATPVTVSGLGNMYSIAIDDMDGDGKPDIVLGGWGSGSVIVLRNTSVGTTISFASAVSVTGLANPWDLRMADLDGDGKKDIVTANLYSNTLTLLRNTSTSGSISFATAFTLASNGYAESVVLADIDGDGKNDIVGLGGTTTYAYRNVATSGSLSAASFAARVDFSSHPRIIAADAADMDGDGKVDVVGSTGIGICIFRNTSVSGAISTSSFAATNLWSFTACCGTTKVLARDMDGDGVPDVVHGNSNDGNLTLFRNRPLYPIVGATSTTLPGTTTLTTTSTGGTWSSSNTAVATIGSATGVLTAVTTGTTTISYNYNGAAVTRTQSVVPPTPVTVTTVTPLTGIPGNAAIIKGTGFNTTMANNVVYFGATKATITAATDTSLNVTIPTGGEYGPVRVTNTGTQLMGQSAQPFLPTFANGSYIVDTINMSAAVNFTGASPYAVVVADFDGDGKPDVATANSGTSNNISVYRNTATSGTITTASLSARVNFAVGDVSIAIEAGDLDNDGKQDIVALSESGNKISIFRNIATSGSITTSSFAAKVDIATTGGGEALTIADVDGDGKPEIIVTNYSGSNVSVFKNTTTAGTITAASFTKVDIASSIRTVGVRMADVNGDNKPDMLVTNFTSNTISVFQNVSTAGTISSASFAARVDFAVGAFPMDIAVADFDGDGKQDLIVSNSNANTVSVLRGVAGTGTINTSFFAAKVDVVSQGCPRELKVGDLNGDGKPDLFATNMCPVVSTLFRNTSTVGNISFAQSTIPLGGLGKAEVVDMDGDKIADIVTVQDLSNVVVIFRNAPLAMPIVSVTSVNPMAGIIGQAVTITGNGFSSSLTGNQVLFGATKATVTSASLTSLNVTVPRGAKFAPVTVTNLGTNLLGEYGMPFLPRFINSGYIADTVNLEPMVTFAGSKPMGVVIADFDGDGKADVATSNIGTGYSISVFRNNTSIGVINSTSFDARTDFDLGSGSSGLYIAAADLDRDGKQDIVAISQSGVKISIFRNTSTTGVINSTSFAPRVDITTTGGGERFAIADIDADGKPEIIVTNYSSPAVSVFKNACTPGTIAAASFTKTDFASGTNPIAIRFADLNADGKMDMVVSNYTTSTISVFRNTSTAGLINSSSFAARVDFTVGANPYDIAIADFDGDAKLDIAVSNYSGNNISFLRGLTGTGTITSSSFAAKVDMATLNCPRGLSVGDFNGDGKPDLAVANTCPTTSSIYRNTSASGSFTFSRYDYTSQGASYVAAGDIDGDGIVDLVAAPGAVYTHLSVYHNAPLVPVVTTIAITSFTPVTAQAGATVTITGTGFNTTAANNVVKFGVVNATVTAATATSLTVTVPAGAAYLPITVTNTATGLTAYSAKPFRPDFDNTAYAPGVIALEPRVDFYTGSNGLQEVAAADIDGDGRIDVALSKGDDNVLRIYRNTATTGSLSSSSLGTPAMITTSAGTYKVKLADLNSDGKPELIATTNTGIISVYRNTATSGVIDASSFAAPVTVSGLGSIGTVVIDDFDGNGKPDVAIAGWGSTSVKVLPNTSTGGSISFGTVVSVTGLANPWDIKAADFDGDGKKDIITANLYSNTLTLLRNTSTSGTISFAAAFTLASSGYAETVVPMDVDGDGKMDIVGMGGTTVYAYRNIATAGALSASSFETRVDYSSLTRLFRSEAADMDGDGKLDVVGSDGSGIRIFRNVSSGSVTAASLVSTPMWAFNECCGTEVVLARDMDGDGITDVLHGNSNDGNLTLFRNRPMYPIGGPVSTSVSGSSTLTNAGSGGTWTSSNTTVATIGSATGVLSALSAGTTTISYTYNGASVTRVHTVTSAAAITGTATVCVGATTALSHVATGGTWTSLSPDVASVGTSGIVTGVAPGTAVISYTYAGGSAGRVVTVSGLPVAGTVTSATGTIGGCTSANVQLLSSGATGGVWTSSNGSVATVGSSTGIVAGVAAGTAVISYSVSNSCGTAYATAVYTVNAATSAATISGTNVLCTGATATWSASITGGTWSSENATVATVSGGGLVTGVAAGTAVISYAVSGSCGVATATRIVTINAAGDAGSISGSSTLCVGNTTTLSTSGTDGTWSSSNTVVAVVGTSGVVTGIAAGTARISYSVGCGAPAITTVTVSATPSAGTISGPSVVNTGASVTLTNSVSGGVWSSSDTDVASITPGGLVTGIAPGTVTIVYAVSGSCGSNTATKVVTVNFILSAPITGTTTICAGGSTTLANATTGGLWSSSNPAVATIESTTGAVSALAAGTTTITYTVSGSSVSTVVSVSALPPAIIGASSVCEGSSTTFTNSVSGLWSSEDVSIATVPAAPGVVTGVSSGVTNISFTQAGTGCSTTRSITVNALPDAIVGSGALCLSTTGSYACTPAGGTWSTGSSTILSVVSSSGLATANAAGNTTITYTTTNGCRTAMPVTVNAVPSGITGTSALCAGSTTSLFSTTAGQTWSSEQSDIAVVDASSGIVSGITPGTAEIRYTNAAGCYRNMTVTVNSALTDITGTGTVCVGGSTNLANATTGGTWSSSAPAIATVSASGIATGISAGFATVTYRSTPTCFTTTVVTVTPAPSVAITGTMNVCVGSTTTLNHLVAGGTWQSGNTSVATIDASGVVTGINAGAAIVTYYTNAGCFVTASVSVNSNPAIPVGSATVCQGSTITLTNSTAGGSWINNGAFAVIGTTSGIVTGIDVGVAQVSYVMIATGCYSLRDITVNATPAVSGTAVLCAGESSTLTTDVPGGTWTSSNLTVANIGMTTGTLNGVASGLSSISYTMPGGCGAAIIATINALPGTFSGLATVCVGAVTTLTATTASLSWSSSDPTIATVSPVGAIVGSVTGVAAGTATISYTNATGCARTMVVTVVPAPAPIVGGDEICVSCNTTFTNTTPGGTWASSTSAATVGVTTGVVAGASLGTSTIVYRTSPSCFVSKVVSVVATPSAPITGLNYVCVGATSTLSYAVPGGTWSSSNTARAVVNATSGVITGVTAGNVVITYTISPGFFKTTTMFVYAAPSPVSGTYVACEGSTATLASATAGGVWTSANTAVATINSATGVYTGIGSGTVDITYTITSTTCKSIKNVTINPLPAAITGSGTVCVGTVTTLANATAGGTWSSSATLVGTVGSITGNVTGVAAGTTKISYTLPTGCRRVNIITVNPLPAAITGASVVNELSSITLASVTTSGAWASSNPSIATVHPTTGVVTGVLTGNATITYQLTATGCYRTKDVTVNPFGTRPAPIVRGNTNIDANIRMYPSPTTGVLSVDAGYEGTLLLYTNDGKVVATYNIAAGGVTISLPRNLAAATYIARFESVDGSVAIQSIVYTP